MLSPVIPSVAKRAMEQLKIESIDIEKILDNTKFDNITVVKGDPLFERIKK